MKIRIMRLEKGQSLMLVTLLLVAFIAILALVLDGGYSYFMRRNSQNAADAGALAGARVLCEELIDIPEGDPTTAAVQAGESAAIDYVGFNDAALYVPEDGEEPIPYPSNPYVNPAQRKVSVVTEISFNTFFGRLLGRNEIKAVALATAGCFSPTLAEGVLPVIWFCKPSLGGEMGGEPGKCMEKFIDWDTLNHYLENPYKNPDNGEIWPELYIVMDSLDYNEDFPCIEEGGTEVVCDIDGDGDADHFAGSGRSWADLDGATNKNPIEIDCPPKDETKELIGWILDGYGCELFPYTWVPDTLGDRDAIFQAVRDRMLDEPLTILPVFDDWCKEDNPENNPHECDDNPDNDPEPWKWHPGEDEIRYEAPPYFHIINFAPFYITCVRRAAGGEKDCPGYNAFNKANKGIIPEINSVATIEGYFLGGYVPGLKGRGNDPYLSNVFTVYLDE